jgi:hypothetical protein
MQNEPEGGERLNLEQIQAFLEASEELQLCDTRWRQHRQTGVT